MAGWDVLGGIAGAAASYFGNKETNRANSALASQQMQWSGQQAWDQRDWEEKMMNKGLAEGDVRWARDAAREDTVSATQWTRNLEAMARAQDYNHDLLTRQLDFQRESVNSAQAFNREMSNTSYQRGMADMRAAGLNPMLAFGQGGATAPTSPALGSPTPSGPTTSAAPAGTPRQSIPGVGGVSLPSYQRAQHINEMGGVVASALQAAKFATELDGMQAINERTRGETLLNVNRAEQAKATTAVEVARAVTEGVRPELIRAQIDTERQRPGHIAAQAEAAIASARDALTRAGVNEERQRQIIQEIEQTERFGRRGHYGDAASTAETLLRRLFEEAGITRENRGGVSFDPSRAIDPTLGIRPHVSPRAEARTDGQSQVLDAFLGFFNRALEQIR